MATNPGVLDRTEGMESPQEVSVNAVSSVIGKGDMVVHLRSGYHQKNIPEYFQYTVASSEALNSELAKYKVEPKVFFGSREAAEFIRNNSLLTTDTYVLNPPGTQMFFVYQLGNIRFLQDQIIQFLGKGQKIESILEHNSNKGPWNDLGIRKPEWIGFDDDDAGDVRDIDRFRAGGIREFKIIYPSKNIQKPR